jgi:hypothetical protein
VIAVVNPPFAVNDEDVHLARIYEIAEGRWLTRGDQEGEYHIVPSDYVALGHEYERVWQKPKGRVHVSRVYEQLTAGRPKELVRRVGRAGSYPPLLYLPHVPALWLARQFDTSALVHLYMVRVAAFLAYAFLAYRAVLASGPFQWSFIVVGLTPMVLTQAAAVSGDGLVIGLTLLCLALLGKGIVSDRHTRGELASLSLSIAALALFKPPYVLLACAFPALPWKDAEGRSTAASAWLRWLFPLGCVLLAAGLYGGWSYLIRDLRAGPGGYDTPQQLIWLRENYGQSFSILLLTFFKHGDELLIESVLVRNKISSLMRFAPAVAFVLHTQLALGSAVGSAVKSFSGKPRARYFAAACLAIASVGVVLALPAAFYLCCTSTGAPSIRVMQGRYFIPALPALLMALALIGRPVLARWLRARDGIRTFAVISLLNALCLFCLIGWHYFPAKAQWPF